MRPWLRGANTVRTKAVGQRHWQRSYLGEGGVGRSIESKLNKLSWKARELIDRNSFQMTSSLRTILVGHPVSPPPLGCSASLVAPGGEGEKRSNEGCSCNSSMQQSRKKAWKSRGKGAIVTLVGIICPLVKIGLTDLSKIAPLPHPLHRLWQPCACKKQGGKDSKACHKN